MKNLIPSFQTPLWNDGKAQSVRVRADLRSSFRGGLRNDTLKPLVTASFRHSVIPPLGGNVSRNVPQGANPHLRISFRIVG
jgi:hypothetical protein